MTALEQYDRLESIGLWKESADAQRREVIVSFGNASLVLADKNENPLTHWSLAAVRKVNKDGQTVTYAPDGDTDEELAISDDLMVKAIETIQNRLRRGLPKPGRLRWMIGGGIAVMVLLLAAFWFPGAIAHYAARVVPDATATQIGRQALRHVTDFSGAVCDAKPGSDALAILEGRLTETAAKRIIVLNLGARTSSHLPGGLILINRRVVESYDDPDVVAGYVLKERALMDETPPLLALFSAMGTGQVLSFLASGEVSDAALKRYAETRVMGRSPMPETGNLAALFELSRIGAGAFADTLEGNSAAATELQAASIPPAAQQPLMRDGSWVALQSICGG